MLHQPGCSVGDKMSVAECGLGCHMEWLIMERFLSHFPNKMQHTLTALRHTPHPHLRTPPSIRQLHFLKSWYLQVVLQMVFWREVTRAQGKKACQMLSDDWVQMPTGGPGKMLLLLLWGLYANGLWQAAPWEHLVYGWEAHRLKFKLSFAQHR